MYRYLNSLSPCLGQLCGVFSTGIKLQVSTVAAGLITYLFRPTSPPNYWGFLHLLKKLPALESLSQVVFLEEPKLNWQGCMYTVLYVPSQEIHSWLLECRCELSRGEGHIIIMNFIGSVILTGLFLLTVASALINWAKPTYTLTITCRWSSKKNIFLVSKRNQSHSRIPLSALLHVEASCCQYSSWMSSLQRFRVLMITLKRELWHKSPCVEYISQLELNGPQTYGIVFCIFEHMGSFSHFKSTENEKIIGKSSWRINHQEIYLFA